MKELKKRKFPPEFDLKVDMTKVKFDVIKKWLARRVPELMDNVEDEFLVNFIAAHLEGQNPDPKRIQVTLTGFLGKKSANLMHELWGLLLDAQDHGGIPQSFVEEKKREIRRRRVIFILSISCVAECEAT
uniref:PWI domain-containing protein n=1 Tax=Arcella intermedia TaxID=1963864 RepID=A0A6B2LNH6_9EUKA